MDIRTVSPDFAVAPQIAVADLAELAERGFVAIVCNRPDGEEDGQPGAAEIREAAQNAGLAFHHIPVSGPVSGPVFGSAFPEAAVAAFAAIRRGTRGPLLAYCRTGTRSITLDTLANPDDLDPAKRLSRAAAAGYDLSGIADQLS